MAYQLKITTTYIGQGLGCTIELLNMAVPAAPVSEYLAIYDFGSTHGNPVYAVNYVVACINRRNPNAAGTHIDALYISHLDADHHNQLPALRNQFAYILNIDELIIGGTGLQGAANPPQNIVPLAINMAGYNIANVRFTHNGYLHPVNNPYQAGAAAGMSLDHVFVNAGHNYRLRLNSLCYRSDQWVFANINIPNWQHNVMINLGSTILLATLSNETNPMRLFSALFTGDATVGTLVHFLNCAYPPPAPPIAPYFAFAGEHKYSIVPHHGSERTVRDHLNINAMHPLTFNGLNNFLNNYTPNSAAVSAQNPNWVWGHPRQSIMNLYGNVIPAVPFHNHRNLYFNHGNQVNANVNRHLYTTTYNNLANMLVGRDVVAAVDIDNANVFNIDVHEA